MGDSTFLNSPPSTLPSGIDLSALQIMLDGVDVTANFYQSIRPARLRMGLKSPPASTLGMCALRTWLAIWHPIW